MGARPFHLGLFLQGSSACFDYLLLEDSSYIGESYAGSREIYLHHGIAVPRQDPSVVAALMTAATSRIGIVPTFGTFAYPPYLLARLMATLDQVSAGRIGWNMVTGSSDFAARNFGLGEMPEHDLRYEMAEEYMALVNRLWASWEPGAIVADTESGMLIDHTKVHQVDFEGRFFRSRGPLNSGPCPQGRPVIAQAGGSPRGRSFAARHADTIVASVKGVEAMRAYRDDVRQRTVADGRDPETCKVLFLVSPIIAETREDAERLRDRQRAREAAQVDRKLAFLGKITNIDFGRFDLDAPIADVTTNGHQQTLDEFKRKGAGLTLRQAMTSFNADGGSVGLCGTPDDVAEQMAEAMETAGGDGFLFSMPDISRRRIAEIEDGLVPALQRRGLTRKAYSHATFRENLLAF